ncbi:MAG: DUF2059 domain-containing protein [Flavobacteriaceae bacterium]|nr:DUF2059 domain-containing protein [Flavobacteriaceae bacterium]
MKKIILTSTFLFMAIMIKAQEKDTFTTDCEELTAILSETTFDPLIKLYAEKVQDDRLEAFTKAFREILTVYINELAIIYKEEFTHSEIKDMLSFYTTPTGKKLAEKGGILTMKGVKAAQIIEMDIQLLVTKYEQ